MHIINIIYLQWKRRPKYGRAARACRPFRLELRRCAPPISHSVTLPFCHFALALWRIQNRLSLLSVKWTVLLLNLNRTTNNHKVRPNLLTEMCRMPIGKFHWLRNRFKPKQTNSPRITVNRSTSRWIDLIDLTTQFGFNCEMKCIERPTCR